MPQLLRGVVAAVVCVALTSGLGVWLSGEAESVAPLWLANAAALAIILRSDRRCRTALLLTTGAALIAVNLVGGFTPLLSVALAALNIVEIVVGLAVIHKFVDAGRSFATRHNLMILILATALCGPAVSGALAAGILSVLAGANPLVTGSRWFLADAVGMIVLLPFLMTIGRRDMTRLRQPRTIAAVAAAMVVTAGITAGVFLQPTYPIIFLIPPTLAFAAFRLRFAGTALAVLAVAIVAVPLTAEGYGPIAHALPALSDRILLLQLFLSVAVLSALPIAASLAERARLAANLLVSEDRFRRIAEATPIGIVKTDGAGRITYANPLWYELTAMAATDDGRWLCARTGEQGAEIERKWRLAARLKSAFSFDRITDGDGPGGRRSVNVTLSPEIADGDVVGWSGAAVDVTAMYRAQEATAESERRYRLLAENSSDMIVRIGLDGVRRYVSPASRTILGFEPEDMMGDGPMRQIHIEDRARVERTCRSLLFGAEAPVCAYRQRHRDGHYVWLEAIYRLVLDPESNAPAEFIATVRDIGKRHEAELAATHATASREESLRLLKMAESMSGVGHWRLDTATEALFWSDEVYHIHGRDPGVPPVLAEGIDAYHPDDRAMVSDHIDRALREGTHWRFQARIVRPDGDIRHVVAHGQAERSPDGPVIGLFGVFQDITDRVVAEQQLIAARDEAHAAADAKSAFLATMSHEIRTPMTGVLGMIELLRSDPDITHRDRYFDSLERSASMLMTVLDDVLDFSKLESRNLVLESIDFDLHELVSTVVQLFQNAASQKGLLLEMTGLDEPLWLRGDPVRFQQILSNLVSNAVKFTQDGTVRIAVEAEPVGRRRRLRIAVVDTGIGIAPADQERLFRPFVQADASTTRRFGGTGLGLAITRHLVEAMHGEIGIESALGQGSTFWLEATLPLGTPTAERPAMRAVRATSEQLRILVAEDNPINQALISALLARDSHDVTCVSNGALATEAAMARRYDLILMDMQMPVMDGIAATLAIRASHGPCADVPIVALTADASAERRDIYRDIGLTDFLTKPIDMQLLSTLLGSIASSAVPDGASEPPRLGVAILDDTVLERLEANLGRANARQLLDMLCVEARDRPRRIIDLITLGDRATAQMEAHGLRGAAAGVGALGLAHAAESIERALDDGAPSQGVIQALLDASRRTLIALDTRTKRRA
ncbi:PAS domain S-box protein [Sphingomonas donggukensis]|uniref:histidine kinase n=1 Tax=Sphingomonas donggukensis TaxID=2949093 RepID=A0ABY4TS43_9SPHN|nr:PAS domain S-box protein [Sphingomonas donggukensis]URW75082.1 PAS domain S-box protein [Sphingomonas donggukensis]